MTVTFVSVTAPVFVTTIVQVAEVPCPIDCSSGFFWIEMPAAFSVFVIVQVLFSPADSVTDPLAAQSPPIVVV